MDMANETNSNTTMGNHCIDHNGQRGYTRGSRGALRPADTETRLVK